MRPIGDAPGITVVELPGAVRTIGAYPQRAQRAVRIQPLRRPISVRLSSPRSADSSAAVAGISTS